MEAGLAEILLVGAAAGVIAGIIAALRAAR